MNTPLTAISGPLARFPDCDVWSLKIRMSSLRHCGEKAATLAKHRPAHPALHNPPTQIWIRGCKGVSRVVDGIPGEKCRAAVIPTLVPVLCGDFRSCAAGMLKLCRIRIAVDFHCPDGRGRHVEFSAIQAVDNNRSSFTPLCCGIRERVNEWQEVIDF